MPPPPPARPNLEEMLCDLRALRRCFPQAVTVRRVDELVRVRSPCIDS
jgi:DNA invertase Pin-like site-specific DNA recombinase